MWSVHGLARSCPIAEFTERGEGLLLRKQTRWVFGEVFFSEDSNGNSDRPTRIAVIRVIHRRPPPRHTDTMPGKKLPATVDEAVWEKKMKGQAGIRRNMVVERVWEDTGGNQDEILFIDECGGCKTKVGDTIEIRQKKGLRRKVDQEEDLKIYEVERGNRDENICARPSGLLETVESTISGGGPGPVRKKDMCQ